MVETKNTREYSSIQKDTTVADTNDVWTRVVGGRYNALAPTLTEAQFHPLRVDEDGYLMCTLKASIDIGGDLNVDVAAFKDTSGDPQDAFVFTDGFDTSGITEHWQGFGAWDETNDKFRALRIAKGDAASNEGYHVSVAGEVVDFDTSGGTDYTPAIGVMGESASGALPVHIAVDDSTMDATPPFLPVGAEYRAAPTTYADGDATVLQSDVNGYLGVWMAGTSKYENAAFGETEDEAEDSEFNTSVIYGIDTEGVANSQLRAVQVAVDNAGISATPNVLVGGGIYKVAFDTYDDNDAVPFHFDSKGRLITSVELNDYIDDAAFTPGTDSVLGIGAMADEAAPDSVDEGDIGIPRMTLDRKLHISSNFQEDTAHTDADYGTFVMSVRNDVLGALGGTDGDYAPLQCNANGAVYTDLSDVLGATMSATNPLLAELTDGTAVVSAANPLNIQVGDGTTQAAVDTGSTGLYVHPYDGTNSMPMMDAAARAGFQQITNGTIALDILVQDAAYGTAVNGLPVFGRYDATPTTYGDGDAVPLLCDSEGRLVSTIELNDYTDDSAEFTPATSKGLAVMALQTADAVDAGDVGAIRMSLNRNVGVEIAEQTLTAMKVSATAAANTLANPMFAQISEDGTNAVGTANPLQTQIGDGTDQLEILTQDAAFGTAATGLGVFGRYDATPITYDDGDAVPLSCDAQGRLIATMELNDYTDDSNEFTVASSKGIMMMGLQTADAVDAGDAGALRMSLNRNMGVDISEQSLTAVKISADAAANTLANPIFAQLSEDGTNAVAAANPLQTQIGDGTTQAGVIVGTTALKTDLSSVAGTATDVDAGNASAGSQRVVLATDDINAAAIKVATEAIQTAAEIMDDWDESDRAKVNTIAGQAGVAAGSGAVDALTQRVILATDDPAVTALEIIDDWDETNRAAVNLIAGQAAITAGAGAVAANTPRVTLASDDPLVAKLDVCQLGAGSQALVNTSITYPSGYLGETMTQWNRVGQVTCTLADRVYDIVVPVAVQDGTNNLCLVELQLLETGWAAPAAGAANTEVKVYRENTADGTAAATAAVEEISMISESKILLPVINDWGLTKIKIASSTAGAVFNIEAKGVAYTPT